MYESYWGLSEKPFKNTLDRRFFYYTAQHRDALMKLTYCIEDRMGAALLSGVFGCGKTFIVHTIIEQLNPERFKFIFLSHPPKTPLDFLISVCSELGDRDIISRISEPSLAESIVWGSLKNQILNNHLNGKDNVIIIDEAHMINNADVFETIRLLLNFQEKDKFLVTLVLVGQPELIEKVENLKPLEQRIAIKSRIGHLDMEETANYIIHRLRISGKGDPIFTKDALGFIYESTGGIPRRINRICDLALLAGFSNKINKIDVGLLQTQTVVADTRIPDKRDEATAAASSFIIPQLPKFEEKDTVDLYNNGLVLMENLITRTEKGEPFDVALIVSFIYRITERLKSGDTSLIILAYKKNTSNYLYNHFLAVCIFSLFIGLNIEFDEQQLIDLGLAAVLHDIGMVNLKEIYSKPCKLNTNELESISRHPLLTNEILDKFKDISEKVKSAVFSHHERINGQGYPKGIKSEEIPSMAMILAVADTWEALTHQRVWRKGYMPHEAILMIRDLSKQFLNPSIVKILVDKLSIYPIGSRVKLNTNEVAEVVSCKNGFPNRIRVLFDSQFRKPDDLRIIDLSVYPNIFIDGPSEENVDEQNKGITDR